MYRTVLVGIVLFLSVPGAAADSHDLQKPVPVLVGGQALDVELNGDAAPFFGDFDGDGRPDLLVGEFYKGRLRIYRNVGDKAAPRFDGFTLFLDGRPEGCVPVS